MFNLIEHLVNTLIRSHIYLIVYTITNACLNLTLYIYILARIILTIVDWDEGTFLSCSDKCCQWREQLVPLSCTMCM